MSKSNTAAISITAVLVFKIATMSFLSIVPSTAAGSLKGAPCYSFICPSPEEHHVKLLSCASGGQVPKGGQIVMLSAARGANVKILFRAKGGQCYSFVLGQRSIMLKFGHVPRGASSKGAQ